MEFLRQIFGKTELSKFVRWEPGFFKADGRTDGQRDVTEIIVAFHNFENSSKKWYLLQNELEGIGKEIFIASFKVLFRNLLECAKRSCETPKINWCKDEIWKQTHSKCGSQVPLELMLC